MNQVLRVYFVAAFIMALAPEATQAATLLSSGTFQAGPVSCSAFSTKPDEITLPAHCLTGLSPSIEKTYMDVDTGTSYKVVAVSLILKNRDTAVLTLMEAIIPGAGFPSRVIQSELQTQFIMQEGYVLYDRRLFAGDSGTPVLRGTEVIGMHIGALNGFGVGVLFGTNEPLPDSVALGVERQFYCGANCRVEECVKIGGFKECFSVEEPVCASARDTHCALLALLDQLRSELNNWRNALFGKQSEATAWQQTVNSTQASVNTKTSQLNTLNSNIVTRTTQISNTQSSINQTTNAITSVNSQITSTIAQQATTTTNIDVKSVFKADATESLATLNASINATNEQIEFNTKKVADLDIVKSAETATKIAREATFAADEITGTDLLREVKELNTASVAIIGHSLPEIQNTASEYLSSKSPAAAEFLKAGTDMLLQINHDLATNVATLPSITENVEKTGSGYEAVANNALSAAQHARELLTALAKQDPLLGPLEERITKELNGEGILRSDKDFWEAMISENSEAAKLSNWLAQADTKTQTWFAERDEAMQEYLADRDGAFLDWIDRNGGWPDNVEKFGNKFSENFKEGNAKISIFYKNSGKELSEGSKALQAELEFLLSSCSKDLTTYSKEFKILAGGQSTDIEGLLNSERPDWETYPAAKLAFVTSLGSWLTRFTERCILSSVIAKPNFKSPVPPALGDPIKEELSTLITKITTKLDQNIEDFGVEGVKPIVNEEFVFPEKRPFPGMCAGLATESGTFSFHKTASLEYQKAAKKHVSETFKINADLCNVGDGIKFTGMLYSVYPRDLYRNGILSSFDEDGRPHRSKYHKDVYHTLGKMGGALSKDMTVGLNFYLQTSRDIVLANKLNNFLVSNANYICDILPPGHPGLATVDGGGKLVGHYEQYGNCMLTPSTINNLERVRKHIGAEVGEQNWLQFLIDEEIMKRSAGLPPGEKYEELRSIVSLWFQDHLLVQTTDLWMYGLKSNDFGFPTHLSAATILLFSDMNMLTQGLADAAESINQRWHADAQSKDFQIENLFYSFLANYTNTGDDAEYERIAQKLIKKMKCWDFFLVDGEVSQECWPVSLTDIPRRYYNLKTGALSEEKDENTSQEPFMHFDWRKGWTWQRAPISGSLDDKYFDPQVANSFGHDLIFLAKLMLNKEE